LGLSWLPADLGILGFLSIGVVGHLVQLYPISVRSVNGVTVVG